MIFSERKLNKPLLFKKFDLSNRKSYVEKIGYLVRTLYYIEHILLKGLETSGH
jgi:hypothetical protein